MPSKRFRGIIFYFKPQDTIREPIHYHVELDGYVLKFWLKPNVHCDDYHDIKAQKINKIIDIIEDNLDELVGFWALEKGKLHDPRISD